MVPSISSLPLHNVILISVYTPSHNSHRDERTQQELETRRRIESRLKAKLEADKKAKEELMRRRTPSPSKHPPTRILHVDNLTRPYNKRELTELLCEDGPIMEEAFWTDRLRSHCIAVVCVCVCTFGFVSK